MFSPRLLTSYSNGAQSWFKLHALVSGLFILQENLSGTVSSTVCARFPHKRTKDTASLLEPVVSTTGWVMGVQLLLRLLPRAMAPVSSIPCQPKPVRAQTA